MDNQEREDLLFDIDFFEGVLERAPHYEESLMALGHAYTRAGLHQKGLEVDRRLINLRPYDPIADYNLACSLSLLRQIDSSFDSLEQAMELGYGDFDYLMSDPDLENVRSDPRFPQIILSRIGK